MRSLALVAGLALFAAAQQPPPGLRNIRLADERHPVPTFDKPIDIRLPASAGVTGDLEMEIVVSTDGSVIDLRVTKSPDPSGVADQAWLDAVRRWRFRPSTNSGQPLTSLSLLHLTLVPGQLVKARLTTVDLKPGPEEWTPPAGAEGAQLAKGTDGYTYPTIIRQINPTYTPEAMRAKIQGTVMMDVTITAEGTVGGAKIRKSLDAALGLDQAALTAVRYWLFKPATRNGSPIAARTMIEMSFNLH